MILKGTKKEHILTKHVLRSSPCLRAILSYVLLWPCYHIITLE